MALMRVRNRLREVRKAKGISAVDLEVLTGIDYQRIYQAERGILIPSYSEKARIAQALGAPAQEIFPPHLETATEILDSKTAEVPQNGQA